MELLREQLRPHDVLYANLRITDDLMDHEADLVVVLPAAGLVVVEVKGGEVWHDGQSWWQRRAGQPVRIHPVDQARDTKYALRRYVEGDPRWRARHRGRFRWAHAVVLPHSPGVRNPAATRTRTTRRGLGLLGEPPARTDGRARLGAPCGHFAESWWPALLTALRDDEHGGLYAFTDDGQRVFPRDGRPPVSLVPLVLDTICATRARSPTPSCR